jgi:translation elongation factor P/translation initiation factor 5A
MFMEEVYMKKRVLVIALSVLLIMTATLSAALAASQDEPVRVTTDQLTETASQPDLVIKLVGQPDLAVSHEALPIAEEEGGGFWVHAEKAIPLPAELGGGYLVGTEEAFKAGLAATGEDAAYSVLDVTVAKAGTGTGMVASVPPGMLCGKTCNVSFDSTRVKKVVLYAVPPADASAAFTGWSGGPCSGAKVCTINQISGTIKVTATFTSSAHISVSPTKIDFKKVSTGKTRKQVFTVVSNGKDYLRPGAITLKGTGIKQFAIVNDTCSKKKLDIFDQCTVGVVFKPLATGSFSGTLNIPSNDRKRPTLILPISGEGAAN